MASLADMSLIAGTFAKAAFTSTRSRDSDPSLTRRLEGELTDVVVDRERLQRYCEECGFTYDGFLPVTYPHALCAMLHVGLVSSPGFPFPVFGVVHVRNSIVQRRRIELDEKLAIRARVDDARAVRTGYEYDIVTHVETESERVWSEVTTFLVRAKVSYGSRAPTGPRLPDPPDGREEWFVDSAQGRRFALASWDFNPIHISGLLAKLFGFGSAIAHGMWMLARGVAAVEALDGADSMELQAFFRRPMQMPGRVSFVHATQSKESVFAVLRPRDGKPHLVASATRT